MSIVVICFGVALLGNIPTLIQYYGRDFGKVNRKVITAVEERGLKKAIIFTRSYYGSVLPSNSPLLDGDIIYARDLGEKNHLLMASFPDYDYYLADGESVEPLSKCEYQMP